MTDQIKTERDDAWRKAPLEYLQAGRLSQKCPADGIVEAAGYYCSSCVHPTGPGYWFQQRKEKQDA